jgi:hypothetical protein
MDSDSAGWPIVITQFRSFVQCLRQIFGQYRIHKLIFNNSFFLWRCGPTRALVSFFRFLDHSKRGNTAVRTPLDEWSARRRDLYLKTHNAEPNIPDPSGIRTHNLSRRAVADLRLRPNGQENRHFLIVLLPNRRSQWPRGLRHSLRPFACWDCGFESHRGHGCFSVVTVVCCQVEVSATDWSLVQRSPTNCGASLYVIKKPRTRGGYSPLPGCENTTTKGCTARKTNKLLPYRPIDLCSPKSTVKPVST